MSTTPGPAKDRIDLIDGLRGFALFGILLANILYWSGWIFMKAPEKIALAGDSQVAIEAFLHTMLIDGKFYTIFSLLFGLGFALQLSRLERRGVDGLRIYRRRLLALLGIGLIHLVLVWDGDILTLYALLGFLLPLFRKWSDTRTLAVAMILLILPVPGVALFHALGWEPHLFFYSLGERIGADMGGTPGNEAEWLAASDWASHWAWLMCGWAYRIGLLLETWRLPKVLGIMLIGAMLGRRLAAGTLLEDRRLFRRTLILGLLIGLPLNYWYAMQDRAAQDGLPSIFGTVPLAFAYAAGFVLLWPRLSALRILAAPGRMALTNYLMHSLLGTLIFYGIGFGLVATLAPVGFYAVALAMFTFQILFSHWWLARHEQGPMEALWRRLTYGGSR